MLSHSFRCSLHVEGSKAGENRVTSALDEGPFDGQSKYAAFVIFRYAMDVVFLELT